MLTGKVRTCMQEWDDSHFDMPMRVGNRTFHTACTIAAFIRPDLAESANMTPGKLHVLKKQPGDKSEDSTLIAVYAHADVAPGHICLASDAMRQAGLMPHSQARSSGSLQSPVSGYQSPCNVA